MWMTEEHSRINEGVVNILVGLGWGVWQGGKGREACCMFGEVGKSPLWSEWNVCQVVERELGPCVLSSPRSWRGFWTVFWLGGSHCIVSRGLGIGAACSETTVQCGE